MPGLIEMCKSVRRLSSGVMVQSEVLTERRSEEVMLRSARLDVTNCILTERGVRK